MKINFRQPTILFGGSFDPVHEGHLQIAREALAALPEVRQFIFVPAGHSPFKNGAIASPSQRVEWLSLTAAMEGFLVWDWELQKQGESYTVDTLEEAHRLGAEKSSLFWLLGADSYETFPQWKSPERIRELCTLLIANRPGHSIKLQCPQDRVLFLSLNPSSSTKIRAALASGAAVVPGLPAPVKNAMDKILPGQNPYVKK